MPESYLDWLFTYLTMGVISFPVLRLFVYLFHRKESPSVWVQEVMAALEKEKTNWERVQKSLIWFGTLAIYIALWPLGVAAAIYALFFEKQPAPYTSGEPDFTCKKKDLLKRVTALEVESQSYVSDPLGRVPDLPFGHLHQGWVNLLAQLEPGDQLWSFKTKGWSSSNPDYPKYSKPQNISSGFAIVRSKKVAAEFICGWD